MEKLQIRYFPVQLASVVVASFEGHILQRGSCVICLESDNNNRMVLYKDIYVSAFGNLIENPQDDSLCKIVYDLYIESGFSPFFLKEKYLIQSPMLFDSPREARSLIEVFTKRNLPITGKDLSRKSWQTFQNQLKKPPH